MYALTWSPSYTAVLPLPRGLPLSEASFGAPGNGNLELGDTMKGTQTQGFRHLFKANGDRKRVSRAAGGGGGGGGGARLQGGIIDPGRAWDFQVHVLLESDMNLRGSTRETHVLELACGDRCKEIVRKYRMTSLLCGIQKEKTQTNVLAETERLTTSRMNSWLVCVCRGGGWVCARDGWALRGVMYTPVCLAWITTGNLLYSSWSSAQSYVPAWIGGLFRGEWIRGLSKLNPLAVHRKLRQHC